MVSHMNKKQLVIWSSLWLATPLVIFLLTWVRGVIGIPLSVVVVAGLFKVCKEVRNPDSCVMVLDWRFWLMAVAMLGYVIFSGIGGLFYQYWWDHSFRNLVFEGLVENPWPVTQTDGGDFKLLSYYLGFWLPSAMLAKFTGSMMVGEMSLLIYAWIGLMLGLMFVFRYVGLKRGSLVVLLVFLLYAGWDIVLMYIYITDFTFSIEDMFFGCHEAPTGLFGDPSLRIQVFCIYNSGIPVWVAFGLLWTQRYSFATVCLVYSLIFLFSPIAALGVLPIMAFWMLKHFQKSLTVWNVAGIMVFVIIGLYYMANNRGGAIQPDKFNDLPHRYQRMLLYVVFTYMVYFPFIWRQIKRNCLFWSLLAVSLLFSEFTLGGQHDLSWRIGLPLICYMTVMVIKAVSQARGWMWFKKVAFGCVLLVGFVGSVGFYMSHLREGYRHIVGNKPFRAHVFDDLFIRVEDNTCYDNFISEGESIFSEYVMRRVDVEPVSTCCEDKNQDKEGL